MHQSSLNPVDMPKRSAQKTALLALLLLVPAQFIGALMSHVIAPGIIGQSILFLTKIWMLALPLFWLLQVDRNSIRIPKPTQRSLLTGMAMGIVMAATILVAYWLLGRYWITPQQVRAKTQEIGYITPLVYLAGAVYWTLINSLLEEYVWRWFVFRKCEILLPGITAVGLSALCFTLHHTLELSVLFQDWRVVGLGSLAVFSAGAIWSACYWLYRSIWSCYISHALADSAIALIGWHLLFA